ncbi:hypothetical protein EJ08DRAFT_721730 [Tothia fuscella]|uniref:BZIP domain-containing protein n=1 Tax=Tothia fuscella TaxID=1048955 RepID=A0A9P4NLI4_9PEZI|nr:hypothetical protein EJ08DRAFT_721730 [Tothia fuscella]
MSTLSPGHPGPQEDEYGDVKYGPSTGNTRDGYDHPRATRRDWYGTTWEIQAQLRSAASDSNSGASRSPLERLGIKLHLGSGNSNNDKKSRDGQAPKRRGPKPDSKPALTRRQELNRQAQRTHRERKEMYIKALEQEVLRLKEVFEASSKERNTFLDEIRRLKELLATHGIQYDNIASPGLPYQSASSQFGGSTTSTSGASHTHGSLSTGQTSPPEINPLGGAINSPPSQFDQQQAHYHQSQQLQPQEQQRTNPQPGVDYDQVGIDFVLTLERPCMDHMQFLMIRSEDSDGEFSGHALMATCPPVSHITTNPEEPYPHKMPEIGMPDLLKLLDLSNRLPLDGEITPIMAWAGIRNHPRSKGLNKEDFEGLRDELLAKIRCYGFGAVLEEFEVKDALYSVLAKKGLEADSHTWTAEQVDPSAMILEA